MSIQSNRYLRGIPAKPYDLIREGLTVFLVAALIITLFAVGFGSPDYPPVRAEDVASENPVAFLKTSARFLSGDSGIDGYGPPYTNNRGNAQNIKGIAPADWFGVTHPISPAQDFVLKPLARAAVLNPAIMPALDAYENASASQQEQWLKNYEGALADAAIQSDEIQLPPGDYGPLPALMAGMLRLGRSGLLEGALESDKQLPYTLDFTRALLFFQDSVDTSVASTLDMTGDEWGISHETGNYPGSWWLWPYTFLYQIPALAASPNADLLIGAIMLAAFLVLLLLPFIPILNRIPYGLRIYRLIWRDWYRRQGADRDLQQGPSP
jgi:hypothetical protein